MSVNKVILIGHLGADPTINNLPSGITVANISLATTERWKDKQGQQQEKTEWHRVIFFGKLAEIVGTYLKKGSKVYIEGKLQTREWEKDGIKRYTTEIVVDMNGQMQMLDTRAGNDQQPQQQQYQQQPAQQQQQQQQPAQQQQYQQPPAQQQTYQQQQPQPQQYQQQPAAAQTYQQQPAAQQAHQPQGSNSFDDYGIPF